MKTLDDQITDAQNALEQAKTSGDSGAQAKAEGCLEGLKNAKEFHTKEFDRVGGKIRSEGGAAKEEEIAKEFGVSIAEAKEIIAEYNVSQEALENEADKERKLREAVEKERDDLKQREANAIKLADTRLIQAELKGSLRDAGINAERLPLALRLADISSVEVKDGSLEGLSGVVETLKKDSPEWFGTSFSALPETPDGSGSQTPKSVAQSYMDRKYGSKEAS